MYSAHVTFAFDFQVVLYTWELQNIRNISGPQIGAYFGYSLASGDIDGDGFDDVIVGSPMFTRTKSEGYEHGRIYVIYQGASQVSFWQIYEIDFFIVLISRRTSLIRLTSYI